MSDNRFKLTIVGTADATSEVIVNELKRLGHAVRAHESKSKGELAQALSTDNPDLVIFYQAAAEVQLRDCQELAAQSNPPTPIILLDDCDPLSNQQEHVKATLPAAAAQLVVQACLREFEMLQRMRELKEVRELLEVSEQRASLLMDKSEDAVGYVADGMLMKANQQLADLLEFDDLSELEYVPFIDLIDESDRERVRIALHGMQVGEDDAMDKLNILCLKNGGDRVPVTARFNRTMFEDEQCVQATFISKASANAEGGGSSEPGQRAIDIFCKHVDDWLKSAKTDRAEGALLVMTVDSFQKLRDRYGLQKQDAFMDALLGVCAERMDKFENNRICYDAVGALMPNTNIDAAKAIADDIVKGVGEVVVDIGEKTSHFTTTVAVLPLNQWVTTDAISLVNDGLKLCGNGNGNEVVTKDREVTRKDGTGEDSGDDPFAMLVQSRLRILFEPIIGLKGKPGQYYETHVDISNWHAGEITAQELIALEQEKHDDTRLDRWLLIEATKVLAQVRRSGNDTRLLLNFTTNGIHDRNFVKWLRIAIKAAAVPPESIALQMDELALSEHVTRASEFMEGVREIGFDTSVTGAGQYHNSESFLKQLQTGFIQTCYGIDDQQNRDALSAMVKQSQREGIRVVVPGVNSVASMTSLWTMGPDFVKGPYFSAPRPELDYDFGDEN